MAWDDPGVNPPIRVNDQQIAVANWGANQITPVTTRVQSPGFVRNLLLRLPLTSFTGPALGAGQTVALQPAAQLGLLRMFSRVQISTQVVNDLLNVRGEDLYFLAYVNSGGRTPSAADDFSTKYNMSSMPQAPNGGSNAGNYLNGQAIAGQTATLGLLLNLPISQTIRQHNTVLALGADGKTQVPIRFDRDTEVGFINVQNDRFAMQPRFVLNPMFAPGVNALLATTGAYAMNAANFNMFLDVDLYPVPDDPNDLPPAELLSMVFQRRNTFTDIPVANGSYTYRPDPAGLLCRYILAHYDANDNLVDISVNPNATLDLQWGTSTHRYVETMQRNLGRAARLYGGLPPEGIFIHDFLADDNGGLSGTLPPELSNTKLTVSGLPAGVVVARPIEERLIPVTRG